MILLLNGIEDEPFFIYPLYNVKKDMSSTFLETQLDSEKTKRAERIKNWHTIYSNLKELYRVLSINVKNYNYFLDNFEKQVYLDAKKYETENKCLSFTIHYDISREAIIDSYMLKVVVTDKKDNQVGVPIYLLFNEDFMIRNLSSVLNDRRLDNFKFLSFTELIDKFNTSNTKNTVQKIFKRITDKEEIESIFNDLDIINKPNDAPIMIESYEKSRDRSGDSLIVGLLKLYYPNGNNITVFNYNDFIEKVKYIEKERETVHIYDNGMLKLEKVEKDGDIEKISIYPGFEYLANTFKTTPPKEREGLTAFGMRFLKGKKKNKVKIYTIINKSNCLDIFYKKAIELYNSKINSELPKLKFENIINTLSLKKFYKNAKQRHLIRKIKFITNEKLFIADFSNAPSNLKITQYENNNEKIVYYFQEDKSNYIKTKFISGKIISIDIFSDDKIKSYTWDEYFDKNYGELITEVNKLLNKYNSYKGCNLILKKEHIEKTAMKNSVINSIISEYTNIPIDQKVTLSDIILDESKFQLCLRYIEEDEKETTIFINDKKIIEHGENITYISDGEIKVYEESDFNKEYYGQEFLDECIKFVKKYGIDVPIDELSFDNMKSTIDTDYIFNFLMLDEDNNDEYEEGYPEVIFKFGLKKLTIIKSDKSFTLLYEGNHNGLNHINDIIYNYGNGTSTQKVTVKEDDKYKAVRYTKLDESDNVEMDWNIDENNKLEVKTIMKKQNKKKIYGYKAVRSVAGHPCIAKLQLLPDSKVATDGIKKMRTDKAKVLCIFKVNNNDGIVTYGDEVDVGISSVYKSDFNYHKGKIVVENSFNPDLSKVCVPGIHFVFFQTEALKFLKLENVTIENANMLDDYRMSIEDRLDNKNIDRLKVDFETMGEPQKDKSEEAKKDKRKSKGKRKERTTKAVEEDKEVELEAIYARHEIKATSEPVFEKEKELEVIYIRHEIKGTNILSEKEKESQSGPPYPSTLKKAYKELNELKVPYHEIITIDRELNELKVPDHDIVYKREDEGLYRVENKSKELADI